MSLPSLSSSILTLGLLQLGNYLIPLLTVPYLARVLGVEGYGQVVFVQTLMSLGILLIDFGFLWSSTRQIAANREDRAIVSAVFSVTWFLQWGLFAIACLVFAVTGWVFDFAGPILWVGCGILLGHVLFPLWLFQGLEMMKVVTTIQLGGRLAALPLLFVIVEGPQDQLMAIAFFSTTSIVTGLFSAWWLLRLNWLRWKMPSVGALHATFAESAGLFVSRLSMGLYSNFIPLAVGVWAGKDQLACYSLADKAKALFQQLMVPVSQALFPRMSWLFKNDVAGVSAILGKTVKGIVLIGLASAMFLGLGSELIIRLLGGNDYAAAVPILRWLAWVPLLDALFTLMGIQILLPAGHAQAFRRILLWVFAVGLPALFVLTKTYGALGTAWTAVGLQLLLVVITLAYIRAQHNSGKLRLQ